MIDLRVYMVWSSAEDDSVTTCPLQVLNCLFALVLDILSCAVELEPGLVSSISYFILINVEFLPEHLYELISKHLLIRKCHERV